MTLAKGWHLLLKEELAKPYVQELKDFLSQEKAARKVIYPPEPLVFNALAHTPYENVKVVIVGQDPYHGYNQAHGLSFSVPEGVAQPPSLQNIFKELKEDLKIEPPKSGSLVRWADQGVLLLNATLTVRAGEPRSHYGRGWERLTDAIINQLVEREDPIVFLLWGKNAQEKCAQVRAPHLVLMAAHPSPFSAHSGFFGCRHFSMANAFLEQNGKTPIDWRLH